MDTEVTKSGVNKRGVNPNVNCLYGKCCPRCGSYGPFEVVVTMRVLLHDNGTGDPEDGSIEYGNDTPAVCYACGYQAKFGEFNVR